MRTPNAASVNESVSRVDRSSPRRVRVGRRPRRLPLNPPPKNMSKMSWMSLNGAPAGPPDEPNVSYCWRFCGSERISYAPTISLNRSSASGAELTSG